MQSKARTSCTWEATTLKTRGKSANWVSPIGSPTLVLGRKLSIRPLQHCAVGSRLKHCKSVDRIIQKDQSVGWQQQAKCLMQLSSIRSVPIDAIGFPSRSMSFCGCIRCEVESFRQGYPLVSGPVSLRFSLMALMHKNWGPLLTSRKFVDWGSDFQDLRLNEKWIEPPQKHKVGHRRGQGPKLTGFMQDARGSAGQTTDVIMDQGYWV